MELRHLRYFVAAAEELHFHRAAERLGIKQPPLSTQIRQLEAELGTRLFRRLTRGVVLTEAGEALLEDARRILAAVENVKRDVARRIRGEMGELNIGFATGSPFNPLLPLIMKAFRDAFPTVEMSSNMRSSLELMYSVSDGENDVAFVNMPLPPAENIRSAELSVEPAVMAVPIEHPLAERNSAPLSALADETLLMVPREMAPHVYDAVIGIYQRAGFTPKFRHYAPSVPGLISMVNVGMGIALVPRSMEQWRPPGVRYVGIEGDAPQSRLGLVWRRDNLPVTVRNFIDVARRVAAEQDGQMRPDDAER